VCENGSVYYAGSNRIYGLSPGSGDVNGIGMFLWNEIKLVKENWIALALNATMVLTCVHDRLLAWSIQDKKICWKSEEKLGRKEFFMTRDTLCFFGQMDPKLYVLDIRNGSKLRSIKMIQSSQLRIPAAFNYGGKIIIFQGPLDSSLEIFAITEEKLAGGIFFKDSTQSCTCGQVCTCPVVLVSRELLNDIAQGFNTGYSSTFERPGTGRATEDIAQLTVAHTKSLEKAQQLMCSVPSSTKDLASWAAKITSNIYERTSAKFLSGFWDVRFCINLRQFFDNLKSIVDTGEISLIVFDELIKAIENDKLLRATRCLEEELSKAEIMLSNHKGIMAKCEDTLAVFGTKYQDKCRQEKVAQLIQSACSDADSLCNSRHSTLSSSSSHASEALQATARFIREISKDLDSSSAMIDRAKTLQSKHHKNLAKSIQEDVPKLDYDIEEREADDIGHVESVFSGTLEQEDQHKELLQNLVASLETSHQAVENFLEKASHIKSTCESLKL